MMDVYGNKVTSPSTGYFLSLQVRLDCNAITSLQQVKPQPPNPKPQSPNPQTQTPKPKLQTPNTHTCSGLGVQAVHRVHIWI